MSCPINLINKCYAQSERSMNINSPYILKTESKAEEDLNPAWPIIFYDAQRMSLREGQWQFHPLLSKDRECPDW